MYSSDIELGNHLYEPSPSWLLEYARSFHPYLFTQYLWIEENTSKTNKDFACYEPLYFDALAKVKRLLDQDVVLSLSRLQSLRLERASSDSADQPFWTNDDLALVRRAPYRNDLHVSELISSIRSQAPLDESDEKTLLQRVCQHNMGTSRGTAFLRNIQSMLLHENLKSDRNQFGNRFDDSTTMKFWEFYTRLHKTTLDGDPRAFRFIVLKPPRTINEEDYFKCDPSTSITQPLFQGFHAVVYSNPLETKCYSRFGELYPCFEKNVKSEVSCTFEAVILPVDSFDNPRSWRCYKFKKRCIFYVVDVYRVEDVNLLQLPLIERLKFVDKVTRDGKHETFKKIPPHLNSWNSIHTKYLSSRDVFDPIVGVVVRDKLSTFDTVPDVRVCQFKIKYLFNLLEQCVVDVSKPHQAALNHLHLSFEMADWKTVCCAYADDAKYIFLCQYNRTVHKFVHIASLEKLVYDTTPLKYKDENLYVLNSRAAPKGVLYLRVYYNHLKTVIGYDIKRTDTRYKIPLTQRLFEQCI